MLARRESWGLLKGVVKCHKQTPSFADIWFIVVKISKEDNTQGVDYCWPVKTSNKGFLLDTLEKLLKQWPEGCHIVIQSTPRAPSYRSIMVIRYKYRTQKVLGFIAVEGSGSNEPGVPHYDQQAERYQVNTSGLVTVSGKPLGTCIHCTTGNRVYQ